MIHTYPHLPASTTRLPDDELQSRYKDAASAAVRNDPFTQAANLAWQDLQGVNQDFSSAGGRPASGVQRPQLAPPRAEVPGDGKAAQDAFTLLMAQLIALVGETLTTSTGNRMAILKIMATANAEAARQRSADYLEAQAHLEVALHGAGLAEAELVAARARLDLASTRLAQAQAALEALPPGSSEHAVAMQARDQAQQAADAARSTVTRAETAYARELNSAQVAAVKVEQLALAIQDQHRGPLPTGLADGMKRQLDANASLILLMLQFAGLMSDASERQLEMQKELFLDMQRARQAYMEKKSEEYQEQVRQAEKMSKIGGCIGKIIGIAAMVVGAVVAVAGVVAGGAGAIAGAALFAVGLALTGGDALVKHFTGVSFMAEAMKPLINNVVMPVIQFITDQLTALLRTLQDAGLLDFLKPGENFAEIAGAALGAIAAVLWMAAVVALGVMAGGAAASKLAGSMVGSVASSVAQTVSKAVGKVFEKIVPRILEHMATASVQALREMGKQLGNVLATAQSQVLLNGARIALTLVEAGGGLAAAGFTASSGVHREVAAKALAAVALSRHVSEQLQELLAQVTEHYIDTSDQVGAAVQAAFEAMKAQQAAAVFVAAKVRN